MNVDDTAYLPLFEAIMRQARNDELSSRLHKKSNLSVKRFINGKNFAYYLFIFGIDKEFFTQYRKKFWQTIDVEYKKRLKK